MIKKYQFLFNIYKSKLFYFTMFAIINNANALDVYLGDQYYLIDYVDEILTARNGATRIAGKKVAEDGNFSQWLFQRENNGEFGVIFNRHNNKVVNVSDDADDAGGPFFLYAHDKYLLLDYGTGPDPRSLSLIDEDGRIILDKIGYWSSPLNMPDMIC